MQADHVILSFFCVILSNFSRKSKKEKMSEKMRKLHELPYMSCLTWAALHGNGKKEWLKHGFLPTCTKKLKLAICFSPRFAWVSRRFISPHNFLSVCFKWNVCVALKCILRIFLNCICFRQIFNIYNSFAGEVGPKGAPPPNWKVPKAFFQSGFVWKILMQREHKFKVLINRRTTGHHCCFGGV